MRLNLRTVGGSADRDFELNECTRRGYENQACGRKEDSRQRRRTNRRDLVMDRNLNIYGATNNADANGTGSVWEMRYRPN
jgi:hypothetical protein